MKRGILADTLWEARWRLILRQTMWKTIQMESVDYSYWRRIRQKDLSTSDMSVVTVYGSEDGVLNMDKIVAGRGTYATRL